MLLRGGSADGWAADKRGAGPPAGRVCVIEAGPVLDRWPGLTGSGRAHVAIA